MSPISTLRRDFGTAALLLSLCLAGGAGAQPSPFASGWTLTPDSSALRFQSVKNDTKVEVSSFATFSGTIDPQGQATVEVLLDSVDTKVDLRNVRMRFLMFETFQYPKATITTTIDPALLDDLPSVRRKTVSLPFTLDLHGVTKEQTAEVAITLLSDDMVSVASATPISVATADYNLDNGIRKLEEAANVKIVPSATVSFDFIFSRNTPLGNAVTAATPAPAPATPAPAPAAPAATATPAAAPASAALETAGNFDLEACVGRFEILSRTDNINFTPASARLDPQSNFLLDSIVDIVRRCPGLKIEVGGHTDSLGSDATNQALSERRAQTVTQYLVSHGVDASQLVSVGYGESRPVADNATREGQRRNRRIEFAVLN
ncbi:OmpA family protein [Oceaniglobus roseus]|uniref:OmpA family protein n=1 Tax=Oceaniglobus roseus TaxID=1737570 RepID=UPI000C7F3541|nr:OmpA family protein [Kandeliimicrobium roseum]